MSSKNKVVSSVIGTKGSSIPPVRTGGRIVTTRMRKKTSTAVTST